MTIHPTARPLPQKTIGVLGGMSNQATGEYYRLLNDGLNARLGGWDNGEIVIVSVNFGNIEHFVRTGDWAGAERYAAGMTDDLTIPARPRWPLDPTAEKARGAGVKA